MQITRSQVIDLFHSLREFHPIPRPGLDLSSTLSANAQRAQLEAERRFGLSLLLNEKSIKLLSELLSGMHVAMKPSRIASLLGKKISFSDSVLIANTFGALLGEIMRQRLGGEWRLLDLNGQRLVALWFDEKNWSLPTYKAGKHFMNGPEDDVAFFYQVFVQKRSPDGLPNVLTITQEDISRGQAHLLELLASHRTKKMSSE